MSTEITKELRCVMLIGGLEIWLEKSRAEKLRQAMTVKKTVEIDGSEITVSQIAGIFTPSHMDEFKRRQNGEWKCLNAGEWHEKFQKCHCGTIEQKNYQDDLARAVALCGECVDGYLYDKKKNVTRRHDCALLVDKKYKKIRP
jgi:hypothetical protein